LRFSVRFEQIAAAEDLRRGFAGFEFNAMELIAFFLFIGAMGKSAQFVLHVWLPDAMEGPTPVSALIHAATMVTAGVFLVCRAYPIFDAAPITAGFITAVGAFTALFAATVALVQNDIKRVIAYSTASQLGYMFFAAGVGAYNAAMFHLFTHAFFKALLFLGAGSVIHAVHHQQDMRQMGGLWKNIPLTYAAMIIGTLAITGIGLPAFMGVDKFGFAGFYSKDAIIEAAYAASEAGKGASASFAFLIGVIAALLTSFYSWRLIFMTFHGEYRGKPKYYEEAHESPANMMVPLAVLSLGAVFAGMLFYKSMMYGADFWGGSIPIESKGDHAASEYVQYASMAAETGHGDGHSKGGGHYFPWWVLWAPVFVSALGFVVAWFMYIHKGRVKDRVAQSNAGEGGPLYKFLLNKWYIDELYEVTILRWTRWFGDVFWKGLDQGVIDRFGPNGVAGLAAGAGRLMSRFQSGHLYHYAFVMLLGLALIFLAVFVF
jgi:NADH-quinone oxidoreductase subunit L